MLKRWTQTVDEVVLNSSNEIESTMPTYFCNSSHQMFENKAYPYDLMSHIPQHRDNVIHASVGRGMMANGHGVQEEEGQHALHVHRSSSHHWRSEPSERYQTIGNEVGMFAVAGGDGMMKKRKVQFVSLVS
jgi:hypothetical protein